MPSASSTLSPSSLAKKRQAALTNLAKAKVALTTKGHPKANAVLDLAQYTKDGKTARKHDLTIQKELTFRIGEKVTSILKQASAEKVLKQSYGVKSLIDTWIHLTKLSYPNGLANRETNPMAQLMGGVLDQFKQSLNININVNGKPAPTTIETTPSPTSSGDLGNVRVPITTQVVESSGKSTS